MKRLSERVLLGGFLAGLFLLTSASCSPSASPPPEGSGNTTSSNGGASSTNHGGAGNVTTGGNGATITGGNGSTTGGANSFPTGGANSFPTGGANSFPTGGANSVPTGGAGSIAGGSSTAGTGGAAAVCSTDANLVNATGCFVGCDPTLTTDNPEGIQGGFYVYGDGPAGGPPKSCPPLVNPPCSATGVCITGKTFADMDYTNGWGCGVGLSLNDTGGTPDVKQLYSGPTSCFSYTLTGSSGGNEVRIGFTQAAAGGTSPYISIPPFSNGKTGTACFKDASCNGILGCTPPSVSAPSGYDIQFQVVGGNNAGSYSMCLTNLTPVTTGATSLTQICGKLGAPDDVEHVGKYDLHNNVNNDSGGTQCVTPTQNGTSVGFKIDSSSLSDPGSTPAAYPAITDGWHYGKLSGDTALPKAMSAVGSVMSTVAYTGSDGKYDASYDMWVLPTLPMATVGGACAAPPCTPAGGLEVMLWLNHTNPPLPIGGSPVGTFMGYNVWVGTNGTWNYVAYETTTQMGFTGNLKLFLMDAITRKGTQTPSAPGGPWLAGVEFGFELYGSGGTGLAVSSYTLTVQ
jgi:Glycosyl hydrolase family 12